MDITTFDAITRSVSSSLTRRSALRGLFAGAAAVAAGTGMLLQAGEVSGKRRKRRKNKKKNKNKDKKLQPGQRCQSDNQCTKGYICEVPSNGSNSDEYCSGGLGAVCGGPDSDRSNTFPFCAVGFDCVPTGNTFTCQEVP